MFEALVKTEAASTPSVSITFQNFQKTEIHLSLQQLCELGRVGIIVSVFLFFFLPKRKQRLRKLNVLL